MGVFLTESSGKTPIGWLAVDEGAEVGGDERRILEWPEVTELRPADQLCAPEGGDEARAEPRRVGADLVVTNGDGDLRLHIRDPRRVQLRLRLERASLVLGQAGEPDGSVGEVDEPVVDVRREHVGPKGVQRGATGVARQGLVRDGNVERRARAISAM